MKKSSLISPYIENNESNTSPIINIRQPDE